MPVILTGNWTFVTKNSYDFRGAVDTSGTKGEYTKTDLHAGLLCLNEPVGMDLNLQLELFKIALDTLAADSDLVNQVLEIALGDHKDVDTSVRRYALPSAVA